MGCIKEYLSDGNLYCMDFCTITIDWFYTITVVTPSPVAAAILSVFSQTAAEY